MTPRPHAQRGAALLTAMIIVTLVATIAGSMVWQQWRAVQVEEAERARTQAHWILGGAIDWARLILREDARTGGPDHLGEPWAVPLAEAKLSTFLAADKDNTDDAPDAFLSGSITDAQARYNLRNLSAGADLAAEQRTVQRLLDFVGARPEIAALLVQAVRDAAPPSDAALAAASAAQTNATTQGTSTSTSTSTSTGTGTGTGTGTAFTRSADPPLLPQRIDQLAWLGLDADTIAQLAPYVTLLPKATPINLNTAPKEVIAAVIEGLDLAGADRLVQARQRKYFTTVQDAAALLPTTISSKMGTNIVDTKSSFFEIDGRLRLQDRVTEERALVMRSGLDVIPLRRERVSSVESATP